MSTTNGIFSSIKIGAGVLLVLSAGVSARADTFTFSFDTLASGVGSTGGGNTATSSIQGYMQNILGAAGTVTVTGAVADKTYTGEGHVVGPGNGLGTATSLTLGNTNGATVVNTNSVVNSTLDTFIANTNDSSSQISTQMVMKFSGLTISGTVSFDYEVFPDGTGDQPDLEFKAGATDVTFLGVTPGTSPINSKYSPDSPWFLSTESSKQLIGHYSGTITNATELDFIDWPATIGIDNLVITTTTTTGGGQGPVPEPASIVLFGTLAAGFGILSRKRRAA